MDTLWRITHYLGDECRSLVYTFDKEHVEWVRKEVNSQSHSSVRCEIEQFQMVGQKEIVQPKKPLSLTEILGEE